MSGKHKHADVNWATETDGVVTMGDAQLAVLMDIRHELKLSNQTIREQVSYTRAVRDELRLINRRMLKAGFRAK